MLTFAEKVVAFNQTLAFTGKLPDGIRVMYPFRENEHALAASTAFYTKYYSDRNPRHLILGINPGRFGAGLTGIPFTDPKRLVAKCGIPYRGPAAHEPSSEFVYEVVEAFGSAEAFYGRFYINSVCPLGFTAVGKAGKEVNHNYYDSKALANAALPFIIDNIRQQIALGVETDICYCLGMGQNARFLTDLNDKHGFFKKIWPLEHPRFVMQYKSRTRRDYIDKYLEAFAAAQ